MEIQELVALYGYAALIGAMMIEGEVALMLAAAAAQMGFLELPLVLAFGAAGTFASDQFYYFAGRSGGPLVERRLTGLGDRLRRVRALVLAHPLPVIFGFRFVYGFRIVTPLAIGMCRVPWPLYLTLNVLAVASWTALFSAIGWYAGGGAVKAFAGNAEAAGWVLAGLAAGLLLLFAARRLRRTA